MPPSIPQDKANHGIYGAAIFSAAYILFHFAALPALEIAAAAVLLAAIGKEIYDYIHRDKHTPDFMDAVATVAGGAISAAPICLKYL